MIEFFLALINLMVRLIELELVLSTAFYILTIRRDMNDQTLVFLYYFLYPTLFL